ncbi:hypothetical protein EF847_00490 [Actinobacteria bacterium YIM 96077]|uniref:Uncharacterized protein n=1 Tax=Phytoactinopolyspora halophila TaxID=1981511 RepID=A0A329R0E6_9ACTN|nr:DUF6092 family protein [Phytoactinopolyspora halophila]AYY11424.1 hypothetical protein EF847_00490 [Actinobacteria bacterium YIM 96077]RAW18094.1 hypothetical protein DPM12_04515 [Phytoactinopolyspora halophila]
MGKELDQAIFGIITHLVTSAPTSLQETPSLAAFRMVDAAHRLMELVNENDTFQQDEFLQSARAEYMANFNLVMTDPDAFDAWLASYVQSFTREALRRAHADSRAPDA